MPLPGKRSNSFFPLLKHLWTRFVTPIGQFSFWSFLLIGIVLCGGVAIWVELLRYCLGLSSTATLESVRTAINTYFPAIGCAAAVQLAYGAVANDRIKKELFSFSLVAACFFSIFSFLTFFVERTPATPRSILVGIGGSVLAILMWWVTNGLDPTFQDNVDPAAATGGPVEGELPGNTEGFHT